MFSIIGTINHRMVSLNPSPQHNHQSKGTGLASSQRGSSHPQQHAAQNALAETVHSPRVKVRAREPSGPSMAMP